MGITRTTMLGPGRGGRLNTIATSLWPVNYWLKFHASDFDSNVFVPGISLDETGMTLE
jgi:hypothetical protein